MGDENHFLQAIGYYGVRIAKHKDFIFMASQLMVSALFPIYTGAHASIRRPPSAAKPQRMAGANDDDDEEDDLPEIAGLQPSDAILFPFLAACMLAGLYWIIKYLKDPALLNKLLTWYFSGLGVVGVGTLVSDSLDVMVSFVFPNSWAKTKRVYTIDPTLKAQFYVAEDNQVAEDVKDAHKHKRFAEDRTSPLPGSLSRVSGKHAARLWSLRQTLTQRWLFRAYVPHLVSHKQHVKVTTIIGWAVGLTLTVLYNALDKPWYLTNALGFGSCYGTLQLLSPTTFSTGSLVLAGLFVYDIVMVFYTPMMVTVAKNLDVPIKIVLPGPRGGMLGLGDIALPGIMIALALRFDLYLHFLRIASEKDINTGRRVLRDYITPPNSLVGELWWTKSAPENRSEPLMNAAFRKTYFHASLFGYIIGMIATMVVLRVFNHAQPALLYLVPGVLIMLWGTALVRGELGLMFRFTEDGGAISDVGPTGTSDIELAAVEMEKALQLRDKARAAKHKKEHAQYAFLFSLSTPKERKPVVELEEDKSEVVFDISTPRTDRVLRSRANGTKIAK